MPTVPSSPALGAALALSGSVLGGLLLGYLAGRHWDWNPEAAVVGLFVGVLAGFYNLAKAMLTER